MSSDFPRFPARLLINFPTGFHGSTPGFQLSLMGIRVAQRLVVKGGGGGGVGSEDHSHQALIVQSSVSLCTNIGNSQKIHNSRKQKVQLLGVHMLGNSIAVKGSFTEPPSAYASALLYPTD